MNRRGRSQDWGFPRWRGYGATKEAQTVRMCDRFGCDQPGTCPAPKAPNSPDRWMFCTDHAAEYNKGWDYFAGLTAEEAAARAAEDERTQNGYRQSTHYQWGGPGDGSRSRDEMRALDVLGLDDDADFEAVKASWRTLAKENHPDMKPGDSAAAVKFQSVQAAFEILRAAEERRINAK
jgi:hypothetical protein